LLWLLAPAWAQSPQEAAEMRLYIQRLEERVRQLTGENEMLTYQLNQLRAQAGLGPATAPGAPAAPGVPQQTGAVPGQPLPGAGQTPGQADLPPGAPPQDLGTLSVSPDDPLIAPDGVPPEQPIDLSTLAGGGEVLMDPNLGAAAPPQPLPPGATQSAALPPGAVAPTTSLSGSARDEYDLAYGYILTGDYGLAEESFRRWLDSFPGDPQSADARFWLGESHLQQREYQEAANEFLALYKAAPDSPKGPDALLKLGVSLAALGEKSAACATFSEVGRRYPQAAETLMSRVREQQGQAGC
jgi:tol-pal system protein YbgF